MSDSLELPGTVRTDEPLLLAHLERDLKLIRRYEFVHSNLPWKAKSPIVVAFLNAARVVLRGGLSFAMGTQDEFNAAVSRVLLEFTRRAATRDPLMLHESAVDEARRLLEQSANSDAEKDALQLLVQEVLLLREQVCAAQLTMAECERQQSELLRRLAALEDQAR